MERSVAASFCAMMPLLPTPVVWRVRGCWAEWAGGGAGGALGAGRGIETAGEVAERRCLGADELCRIERCGGIGHSLAMLAERCIRALFAASHVN